MIEALSNGNIVAGSSANNLINLIFVNENVCEQIHIIGNCNRITASSNHFITSVNVQTPAGKQNTCELWASNGALIREFRDPSLLGDVKALSDGSFVTSTGFAPCLISRWAEDGRLISRVNGSGTLTPLQNGGFVVINGFGDAQLHSSDPTAAYTTSLFATKNSRGIPNIQLTVAPMPHGGCVINEDRCLRIWTSTGTLLAHLENMRDTNGGTALIALLNSDIVTNSDDGIVMWSPDATRLF